MYGYLFTETPLSIVFAIDNPSNNKDQFLLLFINAIIF